MKLVTIAGVEIGIRGYDPSDRAYIVNTWLKSYQPHSHIEGETFFPNHEILVHRLIESARWAVACSPHHETAVHGWACGELGGPLHYAYIPPPLRQKGMARALITDVLGDYPKTIQITHRCPRTAKRFVFNPYPLGVPH